MSPRFDVVGVGTNSVDRVVILPASLRVVAESGKARMAGRHLVCGGQTATAVAACSVLGLRSRYIGIFGSSDEGRLMRHTLHGRGVDTTCAVDVDGPNRDALILIDPDGHRTVIWDRPAAVNPLVTSLSLECLDARVIHVDDDDPELALAAATLASEAGITVTSDLEHVNDRLEQLVAAVTVPIFEEHAPGALTGESDPERALRKLRRLTPKPIYMTLGKQGSVALVGDRFFAAAAFKVEVADTTGAGDVFRAGLIYGLLQKWNPAEQLRFANAAAAVSCTRLGAIPSVPTIEDVHALLQTPAPA